MNSLIRYRLLTIVLLGVLTSAVSVLALVQLLTTSTAQRVERARDAVVDEAERLARAPGQLQEPTPTTLVAMRAGIMTADEAPTGLPGAFVEPVRAATRRARVDRTRVVVELPLTGAPSGKGREGTIVVAALPLEGPAALDHPAEAIVFATYVVRPLPSLQTWQRIVAALACLTVLLVVTSVFSVLTANRGATALRKSLESLASDLHAPVPRPAVRELDAIADGIASLAKKLADSREKEVELARELSQNERLAALGRVAAGVAHEVRNPLASIKLRLDLAIATSASLPDGVEKAIAHAVSEVERLDRLVADLLVMTGRAVGSRAEADLGALVVGRVEALSPWASERGIHFVTNGTFSPALVDVDATTRAIDNLLRNAIEASPPGRAVKVDVEGERARVVVRIEDDGAGVDDARTRELFEPFFTTKPSGTGLGLAISRAIARAHGGDVSYSRIGERTRFSLTVARGLPGTEKAA